MWFKQELPKNLSKCELDKLNAHVGYSFSDMSLFAQYENAVDILFSKIIEENRSVNLIAHPLLYLMRHSLELALKENIRYLNKYSSLGLGKIKTHSISELFTEFENHYDNLAKKLGFKKELEYEYTQLTMAGRELVHDLGTDWSSFRYVYSTSGAKVFDAEETLNVFLLKKRFDSTSMLLTHTSSVISPFTDFADYIAFDKSVIENSFGRVLFCVSEYERGWLIGEMNKKYIILKRNRIWFNQNENHYLHLKKANKKYYIIPMKCII